MTIWDAIILAIVEGLTEFLPVSSTGHMMIAQYFLGIPSDDFVKTFIVQIQFGAILAVVVTYFQRFFKNLQFYYLLFTAFIPAVIFGLLLNDIIDQLLENVLTVGISLFVGGWILVYIDKWTENKTNKTDISYNEALIIGIFQCVAMIPGVSRSAATIIGGLVQKIDRKTAAEFSFFLAVPTMFAASVYKIYKNPMTLDSGNLSLLLTGNVVSFVVAMLAIKFFIAALTKYGFRWFGYYRIAIGLIIIMLYLSGHNLYL